ncbi:MAG: hydroxymethylglutaryl-CoA reductase, degradative [Spirochaetota bacterium]|jgi:hydroxymethylglutaryl-CoA reductase|nr:hydroxymethylglutaryl-CoA reductase, degradative [Spirochaetota bacterium]
MRMGEDGRKERLAHLGREERRRLLCSEHPDLADSLARAEDPALLSDLSEKMIENSISFFALPFGVAENFLIDAAALSVPMVTEEPSVVAAASFAAGLIRLGGGFTTEAKEAELAAQVFLEQVPETFCQNGLDQAEREALDAQLGALAGQVLPSLIARGGGFAGSSISALSGIPGVVRADLRLRVCDAMGANMANTFAEAARKLLEDRTGGRALAAILTNECALRLAEARFSLPVKLLRRAGQKGEEIARRLMLLSEVAHHDRARAITANKGVMNGITALALATGNDTRAVEAAAHAWASRSGRYLPLTRYGLDRGRLTGEIILPLPLASASSMAGLHPGALFSLSLLGSPSAPRLAAIAAALGLAQNLAALLALVGEGIQAGHMRLHTRRTP